MTMYVVRYDTYMYMGGMAYYIYMYGAIWYVYMLGTHEFVRLNFFHLMCLNVLPACTNMYSAHTETFRSQKMLLDPLELDL